MTEEFGYNTKIVTFSEHKALHWFQTLFASADLSDKHLACR